MLTEKTSQNPIVFLVTGVVWLATILALISLVVAVGDRLAGKRAPRPSDIPVASAAVEKALAMTATIDTVRYHGSYKSPFRMSEARAARAPASGANFVRMTFRLKAVLIKDNPLAILEDQQGETYICKAGETIHGQHIVRITADKVVLRDPKGSYEISVQEK
jgi:hypothetical protein